MFDKTTTKLGESRQMIAIICKTLYSLDELRAQLRRDPLICIQRQHPLFAGVAQRAIFLRTKTRPVMGIDMRGKFAANGNCVVRAAGIHNNDFICPGYRLKTRANIETLILCDDDDREVVVVHKRTIENKVGLGKSFD